MGVGFSSFDEAFRWTQSSGMVGLGDLAGGFNQSSSRGVSADGSIVVGITSIGDAFIWDPVNGMRDLQDVLVNEYGMTIPTGWFLRDATAISPDGRYIVGYGNNPSGQVEAWLVNLGAVPVPGTIVLLLTGGLPLLAGLRWLAQTFKAN